jgi:hypothetical protein
VRAPGTLFGAQALAAQRGSFTRTYLGLLQEPEVVAHIRALLTTGKAHDVAELLQALLRILMPPEKIQTGPVSITLDHNVPRPPMDITPVPPAGGNA